MATITDSVPATWNEAELQTLKADYPLYGFGEQASKYNPKPGTGRTGYMPVPPNNYPFYSEEEKYVPVVQADGGQLSEWKPMYHPTAEQAEIDRKKAYETGVPHGYVPPGDKYKDLPTITLTVTSDLHGDHEYGEHVNDQGDHHGGPFQISVSPKMRIEDLRKVISDKSGIIPGLQRLSYAGKHLDDPQRTLEHYGVAYWHKSFPHWALKIRRCE
ncbi:hypothetical protein N2152v2_007506 [Parachlorella kessleri]